MPTSPSASQSSAPSPLSTRVQKALGRHGLAFGDFQPVEARQPLIDLAELLVAPERSSTSRKQFEDDELGGGLQAVLDAVTRAQWSGAEIVTVLAALRERSQQMIERQEFDLDFVDVAVWIDQHSDPESCRPEERADAVAACINVVPPVDVSIVRRLTQTGHQKRVFEARWTANGLEREIVLKQFLDADAVHLIPREMQANPLSMMHPNIIRTYRLENPLDATRPFLGERKLLPLDDGWRFKGLFEACEVLIDVARALAFISDHGLVHGDVKPDNIGFEDGRFLLLDFGVCRAAHDFQAGRASGSLRIRAPELLRLEAPHSHASDIWALGATIFKCQFGHYPLFEDNDPLQWTNEVEREEARRVLIERLDRSWDAHLEKLHTITHRPLRELLVRMFDPEPSSRIPADEILRQAAHELTSLVGEVEGPLFRPWEELRQLDTYLASEERDIRLMPRSRQLRLNEHLQTLGYALKAERLDELIDGSLADCSLILATAEATDEERRALEAVRDELVRRKSDADTDIFATLLTDVQNRVRTSRIDSAQPARSSEMRRSLDRIVASRDLAKVESGRCVSRFRDLRDALDRRGQLGKW